MTRNSDWELVQRMFPIHPLQLDVEFISLGFDDGTSLPRNGEFNSISVDDEHGEILSLKHIPHFSVRRFLVICRDEPLGSGLCRDESIQHLLSKSNGIMCVFLDDIPLVVFPPVIGRECGILQRKNIDSAELVDSRV